MSSHSFLIAFAITLIANACASPDAVADYVKASSGNASATGPATAACDSNYCATAPNSHGSSSDGNTYGSQSNPSSSLNLRGNTMASSIPYPHNRGEILIHRPAAIIVRRPPTKVLVNHPPIIVKPAPVILHRPPSVVLRKVLTKQHPRTVQVQPVYVNVVKPPAEKYFINERQQSSDPDDTSALSDENAAANGYQLLSNKQTDGGNVSHSTPAAANPYAPDPAY